MDMKTLIRAKGTRKLSMITAYSYYQGQLAENAGVDIILVGDSYGPFMLGYSSPMMVELSEMLQAVKAVRRGAPRSFVIGDMPFMSYQVSEQDAVRNAGSLVKAGADAVKLEGGTEFSTTVKRLVDSGIPVMGHLNGFGDVDDHGLRETDRTEKRLLEATNSLEDSGAFSVVLKCVPEDMASRLTQETSLLTFGLGSGKHCDGQIAVWHKLLGITDRKQGDIGGEYASLRSTIVTAIRNYIEDVAFGRFPEETEISNDKGETWV